MIILSKHSHLDERLPSFERDHARVLAALLIYGTLTALEEGRISATTAYNTVLNWRVFIFFRDKMKPRDRILERVLSHGIELDATDRCCGRQAVPPVCRTIKRKLLRWWTKRMGKGTPSEGARSKRITLSTEIPLDELLGPLPTDHVRATLSLLLYGIFTALEEELILLNVAKGVVLNERALRFVQNRLEPRNPIYEDAIARGMRLDEIRADILQTCAQVKAELAADRKDRGHPYRVPVK